MRAKLLAMVLGVMGAAVSAGPAIAAQAVNAGALAVTSVRVNDLPDRVEVYANVQSGARTSVKQSSAGKWIVLNIGAMFSARSLDTGLRNDAIRHIRAARSGSGVTRISVATGKKVAYNLSRTSPGELRWTLWKGKPGKLSLPAATADSENPPATAKPAPAKAAPVKKGTQITAMKVYDRPDRVEIHAITDGKVGAWCNRGQNGRTISLGIMADYRTKHLWKGILNDNVVHVEAGLFQSRPAMSRVVVSVTQKVPYDLDTSGANSVVLTVWKSAAARQAALSRDSERNSSSAGRLGNALMAAAGKAGDVPVEKVAAETPEEFTLSRKSETAMGVVEVSAVQPVTNFRSGAVISQPVTEMAIAKPAEPASVLAGEPSMSPVETPDIFAVAPRTRFTPQVITAQAAGAGEHALAEPAKPVIVASTPVRRVSAVRSKVAGVTEEIDASQLKPGDVIPPSAELKAADPVTGEVKDVIVKDASEAGPAESLATLKGEGVAATGIKTTPVTAAPSAASAVSAAPGAPVTGKTTHAGRYVSANTRTASATASAEGSDAGFTPSKDLVSLNFVGTDINDVLKALTMQSGSNIVTATDVKGEVTVALQNVNFESALNSITKLSGYSWMREGNTYYVASDKSMAAFDSPSGSSQPTTKVIAFNNATASEMLKLVNAQFPTLSSTIPAGDGNGKSLIVTGPGDQIAEAASVVQRMDAVIDPTLNDPTVEIYHIRYSKAKDLLKVLEKLVPGVQSAAGAAPAGLSTPGSSSTSSTTTGAGSAGGAPGASDAGATASVGGAADQTAGSADSGARTLVLSGPTALVKRALSILDKVDTPLPQVLIEAKVVDIDASDTKKLGITYDWNGNGYTVGIVNNVGNLDSLSQPQQVNPNLSMLPTRLTATLDGKIVNVNGNILASPKISVLDGQPARIFIGDVIRYIESIQANSNGTTVTTGSVSAGVDLQCMPLIDVAGDRVTMRIHPEASTPTFITDPRTGITLPQVATRFADSTIRVKSGQTIVIGGLISQNESNTLTKIPFLGDLPFLGQLFRHRDKSSAKRELMIFITSTILKDV